MLHSFFTVSEHVIQNKQIKTPCFKDMIKIPNNLHDFKIQFEIVAYFASYKNCLTYDFSIEINTKVL